MAPIGIPVANLLDFWLQEVQHGDEAASWGVDVWMIYGNLPAWVRWFTQFFNHIQQWGSANLYQLITIQSIY